MRRCVTSCSRWLKANMPAASLLAGLVAASACSSAPERAAVGVASAGGGMPQASGGKASTNWGAAGSNSGGARSNLGGQADSGGTHAAGGNITNTGGDSNSGLGGSSDAGGSPSVGGAPGTGGAPAAMGDPCPPQGTPCRIMPLGGSITFGVYSSSGGGYRVTLFQKAIADNHNITFVGSAEPSGPEMVSGTPFPQQNEGHNGITISGVSDLVDASIAANQPNIILLHIGTNDFECGDTTRPTPASLAALVDKITADAPNALLVVAQIIPINVSDAAIQSTLATYNAAIPAMVSQRAQAGKHIAYVDMNGAFKANLSYATQYYSDMVHPNDTGYDIMGGIWYQAISGVLH